MKRTMSRPIILTLPTYERNTYAAKPRILPFPVPAKSEALKAVEPDRGPSAAELSEVRERLFRMIVANQWDRSHGNRAS
jgi:hypothetical protein